MNKTFLFGIIIGVCLVTSLTAIINMSDYGMTNLNNFPNNLVTYKSLQITSMMYNESHTIAQFCLPYEYEEQVECVISQVNTTFVNHTSLFDSYTNPTELQTNGEKVCRDFSIFYSAIFSLLGWDTEFIFEPGHVYNYIERDVNESKYYSCQVDISWHSCRSMKHLNY